MAFELARKDILGRRLSVAASMTYKVLTREAYTERAKKIDRLKSRVDEEKALKRKNSDAEGGSDTTQESPQEESGFSYFNRRRKKELHFRGWMLKASYFVNSLILLSGTVYVNKKQSAQRYHCESLTVMFGDEVFENAYVTDLAVQSQPRKTSTLVYSYFNGVYKIDGRDDNGYPIYTEMNKVSGNKYNETVGAEFVYCKEEEAWIFRHKAISKFEMSNDKEVSLCFDFTSFPCFGRCLQSNDFNRTPFPQEDCSRYWLLRSPPTAAYDLTDVLLEDWSVWTGVVTPANQMSIVCNTCRSDSDW